LNNIFNWYCKNTKKIIITFFYFLSGLWKNWQNSVKI